MTVIFLLFGFVLLIKGADVFVTGAGSVAKKFNIPDLVIGLTVVAFGTSAPELAVSSLASVSGQNSMAISNIVGSNIFNLLVVLGVCSMIKPINVEKGIIKKEIPLALGISCLLFILLFDGFNFTNGVYGLSRVDCLILLICFVFFMFYILKNAKNDVVVSDETEEIDELSTSKSVIYILIGLTAVVFGGNLVVNNATLIAQALGVSETVIGLTIVAMGTSLPELVTSVIACRKGSSDMAMGNVIGSNIFNMLLILGVSGTISPLSVDILAVYDAAFVIMCTVLVLIVSRSKYQINRLEGAIMLCIFASYNVYIFIR